MYFWYEKYFIVTLEIKLKWSIHTEGDEVGTETSLSIPQIFINHLVLPDIMEEMECSEKARGL